MMASSPTTLGVTTGFFHFFVVASLLCSLFLMAVQLRLRKNAMAIIMCVLMSLMYLILLGFAAASRLEPYTLSHQSSLAEAFTINYLLLATNNFLALIIFDNCLYALHLKQSPESVKMSCPWYYMLVAVCLPIVPVIILVCTENLEEFGVVQPSFLYASFTYVYMISTGAWIFIVGLLGIVSAVTILYKTIRVRENTLKQFSKSHIPRSALYRWGFGALIYTAYIMLSSLPSVIDDWATAQPLPERSQLIPRENLNAFGPFAQDASHEFLQFLIFPKIHQFVISMLGLVVFALFGTSQQARGASRELWGILTCMCCGLWQRQSAKGATDTSGENDVCGDQPGSLHGTGANAVGSGDKAEVTSQKTSSTISQGRPRARRLLSIDSSFNEFRRGTQFAVEPAQIPAPVEEEPSSGE